MLSFLAKFARLAVFSLLVIACSSSPNWVSTPQDHSFGANYIVATGAASLSGGEANAREAAIASARSEMSALVRATVNSTTQSEIQESTSYDDDGAATTGQESLRESIAVATNEILTGSELLATYIDEDAATMYALIGVNTAKLMRTVQPWIDQQRKLDMALASAKMEAATGRDKQSTAAMWQAIEQAYSHYAPVPAEAILLVAAGGDSVAASIQKSVVDRRPDLQSALSAYISQAQQSMTVVREGEQLLVATTMGTDISHWAMRVLPGFAAAQPLTKAVEFTPTFTNDQGTVRVAIVLGSQAQWPLALRQDALGQNFDYTVGGFAVRKPSLKFDVRGSCITSVLQRMEATLKGCASKAGFAIGTDAEATGTMRVRAECSDSKRKVGERTLIMHRARWQNLLSANGDTVSWSGRASGAAGDNERAKDALDRAVEVRICGTMGQSE